MNDPGTPRRRAYRCTAGCLHLQWDRLILNFTPDEFAELRALIERAAAERPAPVESAPAGAALHH